MNTKKTENVFSIVDLLQQCAARWRWFIVSVAVCLLFAVYHLKTTPHVYKRQASVMVLEESLGNNAGESKNTTFTNIGFVSLKTNVINVMRHITSLDVLMEVARRAYPDLSEDMIFDVAVDIQDRLSAENEIKNSSIIDLTYRDYSTEDAYRILSLVIQVYADKWMENRFELTRHTSKFIDSRMALLEADLDVVDDSIAKYKSSYGITELKDVSDIYLRQQSESEAEIVRLSSQREMAEYIRELLEDKKTTNQLLLANSGINNDGIEAQITMYNNMVLELQGHLKYSSEQNPAIANQQEQIASLRQKILTNIIKYIHSLDIQLESLIDYNNEAMEKITSNPAQAKYLATIERERTVKENLYTFLLQKKEENEISSTYQAVNIQVIDAPHGSGKPVSPKRGMVFFAAIFLGLLIPITIIFLNATMSETVKNHHDVERHGDIPFLGEIPMSERTDTWLTLARIIGLRSGTKGVVVARGKQTPINEAFRLIRTKLENATDAQGGMKGVYMVASDHASVGKTFVSMNLATVLAIGGRRVLFIDGDLRRASASKRWSAGDHGLTDYLEGRTSHIASLLFHPEGYPQLDVLPAGALPANPTELLDASRLKALFEEVRPQYDLVIIDTPPIGKLADAEIIGKYVDRQLFVIRAGVHKRTILNMLEADPDAINAPSRYVILNGVNIDFRYAKIATRSFFHWRKKD